MTTVQPLGPFLYEFKDGVAKHPLAVMNFMPALPNLAAWYDSLDPVTMLAGDGSTITDGGAVALWADKSGNSGVNCLVLPGTSGNYASIPDSAAIGPADAITIDWFGRLFDFTPPAEVTLVGKYTSTQKSYALNITTGGRPKLYLSTDGSADSTADAGAAIPVVDYDVVGVRATWRKSDGKAKYYYSTNLGETWAQVGSDQTIASGSSIFDGTSSLFVGSSTAAGGGAGLAASNIRRVRIYGSFDAASSLALDIDFSTAGKKLANGDTFVCATGQTVTLNSSGATGARIAGERDLFQGTAANRPVYLAYSGTKYGYLNGAAGNYFSTPDSAAVSVTGANELRCSFTPPTMTPSGNVGLVAKWSSTGDQRSFGCSFTTTSALVYLRTANGIDTEIATSSATLASVGFAANQLCYVKVTHDTATGTVKFYYSADGSSYMQLGTDRSVTAGANYDGTGIVTVGILDPSPSQLFTGRIYRAQIYDGIGGTLVADFNPALYQSGTTFTASTGEVWTINGGAHIVTRTGLYFPGATQNLRSPAFSLSQPETVYLIGEQVSWTINDGLYDGNSLDSMQIAQTSTTPRISMYAGAETGIVNPVLKTAYAITNVFNGASSSGRLNRSSAASGNAGTSAASGFVLGAKGNVSAPANIFVSELAIYSAAHDTATQDRVILAMGRKHGFSV